jgi:hypothetical protein
MKALETVYKGVRFRSRIEARHAILFDQLEIKWEYEPEGFKMKTEKGTICYLPDFYLPEVYLRGFIKPGVYFEVKPSYSNAEESQEKFNNFDGPLVVACGTPDLQAYGDHEWMFEWHKDRWDNCMYFKYCEKCMLFEIEFSEGNYCVCPKCGEYAGEIQNWGTKVAIMKSHRF